MLKTVFQLQVFVCLAFIQLSLSAEDCIIDSTKILTVPTGGCTLVRSENEIVVDKLILNGELLMDKMNHLKYKSMEVNAGAALKIISKYEKIVFEDIGDDPCDFTNKKVKEIELSFKSNYKNTFYDIQSVSNQNELLIVNRIPLLLYKGAKVAVMFSKNVEYSEVDYVDGQKVFLKTSLTGSYYSFISLQEEFTETHPKLFLLDESTIFFRNNCLNAKIVSFGESAVFEDLKGLNYFSDSLTVQLREVLFIKTKSFIQNKFDYFTISVKAIERIVLIGDIKQIFFLNQYSVKQLFLFDMQDLTIQIDNRQASYRKFIFDELEAYSSNINVVYYDSTGTLTIQSFFRLIFSTISVSAILNDLKNSLFQFYNTLAFHSSFEKITGFKFLIFTNSYFEKCIVDLSNLEGSNIYIGDVIMEGTDLLYAVKFPSNLDQLELFRVGFFGFKQVQYPILYFPSVIIQESENSFNKVYPLNEIKFPVTISNINLIDCHQDSKLISLPSMTLFLKQADYTVKSFQAVSLPDSVYSNKPIPQIFKPWLTNKPLYLIQQGNSQQLSTLYLSFEDQSLNKLFQVKLTTQNGEGIYSLGEPFYLIHSFSYRITIVLISGQTLQNTNLKLQVKTDFYKTYFLQNSLTILIDAAPYAVQTITNNGQSYSEAIINDLDKGIYITQTIKKTVELEIMNSVYSISFCPSGQVNEGGSCVSSCDNSNIFTLYGQCFNTFQKDYYYFAQDLGKSLLVSCPINCLKCTNNPLICQSCKFSYGSLADNCRENEKNEFINFSSKSISTCTIENCEVCNQGQCFFCKQNYALDLMSNSCKIIQENQVMELNQLVTCPKYCKKCINKRYCIECQEGHEKILGFCQNKCEQNQYFSIYDNECSQCNRGFTSCQYNNYNCPSNTYLQLLQLRQCSVSNFQNQICDGQVCYECYDPDNGCSSPYQQCEKGFSHYQGSDICVQCSDNCVDCDLPNNCIQCDSNQFKLVGNKCVKQKEDENNSIDDNSEDSLDDGQIIGIVLGSVFGSLFIILLIFACCRYYKARILLRYKSNQQVLSTQNEKQSIINTDLQQIQTQVFSQ